MPQRKDVLYILPGGEMIRGGRVRVTFEGRNGPGHDRDGSRIKVFIQTWCEQHRDKWPKDGETITLDLDEVQVTRQRLG